MKHPDNELPALVLFRSDLRLSDNRALAAAAAAGGPILAVYIHDAAEAKRGGASLWWRHYSLKRLAEDLARQGIPLILRAGDGAAIAEELIAHGTCGVFWNRRYSPDAIAADSRLKATLRARGIMAKSFEGHLLHEPSLMKTGAGGAYKVYTPFRNALMRGPEPRSPVDAPASLKPCIGDIASVPLDTLIPLPQTPDWAGGLRDNWTPGEAGAQKALDDFLESTISGYATRRDIPGIVGTSRLSPHLAHGEITPYQILDALAQAKPDNDSATFRNEIIWREFCYHLLFHYPDLVKTNYNPAFNTFPWHDDPAGLRAWQRGQTGYPIVDAGMRELWHTGWMHNRVRMIVASFLTKHLLIDWRAGEAWFNDTLVDADPASNPASWQWVAGSGADAAPYFRIFNPVLQSRKFDPLGHYLRQWLPELANMPDKHIHSPWQASAQMLRHAGVTLGKTWPHPIVDHTFARNRALEAWQEIR